VGNRSWSDKIVIRFALLVYAAACCAGALSLPTEPPGNVPIGGRGILAINAHPARINSQI
jgi:hypothetical protein